MSLEEARHLVGRTGLGVVWAEVERLEGKTRDTAATEILATPDAEQPAPPDFHDWGKLTKMRRSGGAARQQAGRLMRADRRALQAWLSSHLQTSGSPMLERMCLLWHGHLTSSLTKVPPAYMLRQHQLFRRHALGRFDELLRAASFDPAMLIYLDGLQNRRGQLNENFARELLELFTLGEGHYTESDIQGAARAFTGWRINYENGEVYLDRRRHDNGAVHFLGRSGRLSGNDIVDILLEHPRTARRLAEKLWHGFVSEAEPPAGIIADWADKFRRSDYNISDLMHEILRHEAFWSPQNRGALTKSPVDLVIGGTRELGVSTIEPEVLARWCRNLGQDLLNPPTVAGWKGGSTWINTQTLLARQQFIRQLIGAREITRTTGASADQSVPPDMPPANKWETWLLPISRDDSPHSASPNDPEAYLTELMIDPRYQLR